MKVNSKWMKALSLVVGVVIVGLVLGLTPTVWSFLTSSDSITNPLDLGKVDIEVDEDFDELESWDGTTYDKIVRIQNLGTKQSLIRVAVVPRWENADGTAFAGDVSLLSITFDNVDEIPGWTDGSDGYYYYTAKVETGASTEPVMISATFLPELPDEILARYNGKKLIIDVQAEAVHAYQPAYEAVWSQMANSGTSTDSMLEALIVTP